MNIWIFPIVQNLKQYLCVFVHKTPTHFYKNSNVVIPGQDIRTILRHVIHAAADFLPNIWTNFHSYWFPHNFVDKCKFVFLWVLPTGMWRKNSSEKRQVSGTIVLSQCLKYTQIKGNMVVECMRITIILASHISPFKCQICVMF